MVRSGVLAEAGQPKRKTYLLADRFSNIHYLMRHGRAARNRFDWFIKLVCLIFPDKDHETIAKVASQTAECGLDGLRDARDLISSALSRAASDEQRHRLLGATLRENWDHETKVALSDWLDLEKAAGHGPEAGIVKFFLRMPRDLQQKLGFEPSNARWWLSVADSLAEKEIWIHVVNALRKATELEPKLAGAWNDLGYVLEDRLGRHLEAETAFRKAIEIDPIFPHPWNNLGNLLLEPLRRYAEAEMAFRRAIELDTNDPFPWNGLGNLLTNPLARYDEAEAAYREATKLDPNYASPWFGLGNLLKDHLARYEEAEAAFRRATSIDPTSAVAWNGLGGLLRNHTDRHEQAEDAYRRAIESDANYGPAWNGLGNLLLKQPSRHKEAEAAYLRAAQIAPSSSIPWSNLGRLLLHDPSRYTEAEAAFRKATEIAPHDTSGWSGLCLLFARTERHPESRSCAVKIVALSASSPFVRDLFSYVCQNHPEDWRAVLPGLAAACSANPKDEDLFDFTLEGFLQLARLTKPSEPLAVIEALSDPTPFETVAAAFRAQADREHLERLAPERRAVALRLLERLSTKKKAV
jgi:Flp pilus assembly protein TadD